jgi:3-oxoacyl-[acyl-carrier-protein] synthase III
VRQRVGHQVTEHRGGDVTTEEIERLVPMTISWLGNSSVATIPTLLDLLERGEIEGHSVAPGDLLVFASVGAGMNSNAMVYRVPPPLGG